MLSKTYIQKIKKEYLDYAEKRRDVIKFSGDALHCAKRAIFAMHRRETDDAGSRLAEAEKILKQLNQDFSGQNELFDEGSYRAALEEYVEAKLFCEFVMTGKMSEIDAMPVDSDVFLAGLCDVPGELCRYAVNSATNRQFDTVAKCKTAAEEIIGELMEFDLTSYLRNKFDQAKGALNKIEQIVYEVSLKK
ncbi:MAG: hypothetical protein WCT40_00450 [Candidatus Magasanikbacteria bacterium]